MRILVVNDYDFHFGGAETSMYNTCRILKSFGNKVHIIGLKSNKSRFPTLLLGWFSIKYFLETIYWIVVFKPDVAHIHNCIRRISPSVAIAAKFMNIPVVMTVHDFNIFCPDTNPCDFGLGIECFLLHYRQNKHQRLVYLLIRTIKLFFQQVLINNFVNYFICPSKICYSQVKQIFKKNVYHLPNFHIIDRRIYRHKRHFKYFLYIGRLSEEKGVNVLLKAMRCLIRTYKANPQLKIVGIGPELASIEQIIKQYQIQKNVEILGYIKHQFINRYLYNSIALIVPSIWKENSPMIVNEAFNYCIPIIATRIGGLPEIINHNQDGFLFKKNNAMELAKYMNFLYKNPEVGYKMGLKGFHKISKAVNKKIYYKNLIRIYQGIS